MRNDGQKPQGGVPRSSSSGRSNGFFPSSLRAFSSYLRIMSSGASSVASTVRSAGVSVASSIAERVEDGSRDQVQWAGFDKLETEADIVRRVLLLGYRSGFQVWDVEEADDVRELVSRHDGPVSFMQVQPNPLTSKISADEFANVRPLLVVAGDGAPGGGDIQDAPGSPCNGSVNSVHEMGNRNFLPTVVRFYSLRSHSYVHVLKFRTAIYSVRCSPRVVAISQAAQIHCFNATTLEREYTILTYPIVSGCTGSGGVCYGPLAVGPRWLAYTGSPISISNTARVSPQHLTSNASLSTSPSNGSLVAQYAKESTKQIAAGIVTLGDVGYKKLSRYCSELLPDCNNSVRAGNLNGKTNGTSNGHLPDAENVGTVIIRDIVSKLVVAQFRAHRSPISALCFNPSGTLLVTASVQGHNINVFRIMPSPLGSSSGFDATRSHVHLYRLQRGFTNAVIQDISFSDDSQWIMISSSRGTSHLFAISPSGGAINLQTDDFSLTNGSNESGLSIKHAVRWPPSTVSSKPNPQSLCASGPPVTLSVVSRIKNGNNGWRGTVTGAAAAATGRVSSLSGAIASAFHNCKGKGVYPDTSSSRTKHHLLVFSPSGCIIQYVLRLSTGVDSIADVSGLTVAHYESAPDADVRLVVEALQKWDVCQRQNRREREDNVDIYGEHANGDNSKLFPKGPRKGASVYPSDNGLVRNVKQIAEDKHHLYISEAELQMHPARVPLWAKSQIYFHVMMMDGIKMDSDEVLGGEVEIERVPTRMIEARSKDLVPVFDYLQTPKCQQSRVCSLDSHRNGPSLLHQKPGLSEDGRLSQRSSCSSFDGMPEGAAVVAEPHNGIEENGWGCLRVSTESIQGFVNNSDSPRMKTQLEFVNNRESPKMEAQLQLVNNKQSLKMETHFEDGDNESV
ncbi:autophagy-related protein 18f-like isoform X2 [Magnolia sinica]|uniref:autophagy-related protein 18f-like isoform X2 n=1 Tax=Magnolia sinica TaxID=86752 RepID=UPI00265AFB22|nr:autophagy-related protein 18f-like isoform X2 [Magnolia sinica]